MDNRKNCAVLAPSNAGDNTESDARKGLSNKELAATLALERAKNNELQVQLENMQVLMADKDEEDASKENSCNATIECTQFEGKIAGLRSVFEIGLAELIGESDSRLMKNQVLENRCRSLAAEVSQLRNQLGENERLKSLSNFDAESSALAVRKECESRLTDVETDFQRRQLDQQFGERERQRLVAEAQKLRLLLYESQLESQQLEERNSELVKGIMEKADVEGKLICRANALGRLVDKQHVHTNLLAQFVADSLQLCGQLALLAGHKDCEAAALAGQQQEVGRRLAQLEIGSKKNAHDSSSQDSISVRNERQLMRQEEERRLRDAETNSLRSLELLEEGQRLNQLDVAARRRLEGQVDQLNDQLADVRRQLADVEKGLAAEKKQLDEVQESYQCDMAANSTQIQCLTKEKTDLLVRIEWLEQENSRLNFQLKETTEEQQQQRNLTTATFITNNNSDTQH